MKQLKKWLAKKSKKEQPSLHQKINDFIDANKNRTLPKREARIQPELLIPCFNHGEYLPRLIKAVSTKSVPITIIDDNSNAQTKEIIKALASDFRFKIITNEVNLKQSGSLNKAISESSNNLFMVANADDFLMPNWIDYAIKQFERTDISMLGGMHIDFLNHFPQSEDHLSEMIKSIQYIPKAECKRYGPEDARNFTHDNSIDMTMSGCTFLKSAWEFVGGFYSKENRVSIHDDRDFQMRVCAFFDIAISSEISAFWRTDSSTGMGTK